MLTISYEFSNLDEYIMYEYKAMYISYIPSGLSWLIAICEAVWNIFLHFGELLYDPSMFVR